MTWAPHTHTQCQPGIEPLAAGDPYGRRCEHGKLCASRAARRGEINYPDRSRLRLPVL